MSSVITVALTFAMWLLISLSLLMPASSKCLYPPFKSFLESLKLFEVFEILNGRARDANDLAAVGSTDILSETKSSWTLP